MADRQLTPQQWKAFYEALLEAFPSPAELERMVRFGLHENLYAIASASDLKDVVFRLITWAEAQGRLSELIAAARNANPGNPALQNWMQAHSPAEATSSSSSRDVASASALSLTPALLRERITDGLSRSEVGVLWYDVLGGQMDDEMPGRSQLDCVIELLTRVGRRNRLPELVAALGRLYPHISLSTE